MFKKVLDIIILYLLIYLFGPYIIFLVKLKMIKNSNILALNMEEICNWVQKSFYNFWSLNIKH